MNYLIFFIVVLVFSAVFEANETDSDPNTTQSPHSDACPDGWFAYLDQKCFKVSDKKITESEAVALCQADDHATLVSIHSKEEMKALEEYLTHFRDISDNVWIGLKYEDKVWKWLDNTDSEYQNWSEDTVKDGSNPCVQLSLGKASLGKWDAVSCSAKSLAFCQRKQTSLTIVWKEVEKLSTIVDRQQTVMENMTKIIDKQQEQISELHQATVPVGFIYTQLPNQSAPEILWPQTKWSDVSKDYAGLFFRAEGGDSIQFGGGVQLANQTWISQIGFSTKYNLSDVNNADHRVNVKTGAWTSGQDDSGKGGKALHNLDIYTTGGETRPINIAVRVWERIK